MYNRNDFILEKQEYFLRRLHHSDEKEMRRVPVLLFAHERKIKLETNEWIRRKKQGGDASAVNKLQAFHNVQHGEEKEG